MGQGEFKYWAFISYSHEDKAWGDWLHKALESYRVPRKLVGRASHDGTIPRRLYPVFRDREELPSSADLSNNINDALALSRCLVVICSPKSAVSRWVDEEIKHFKKLGRENRVLALIVDGEPNASDKPDSGKLECFPPALRHRVDSEGKMTADRVEPIAADARAGMDGRRDAKLKLLAGLLGVAFDELKQRERQRVVHRRTQLAVAAVAAVLAVFAGIIYRDAIRHQEREAEWVREVAGLANTSVANGDSVRGLLYAALVVPRTSDLGQVPYDPAAEVALEQAAARNFLQRRVITGSKDIGIFRYSPDGTRILVVGEEEATASLWSASDGARLVELRGSGAPIDCASFSGDGHRIVTTTRDGTLGVWDVATGTSVALISSKTSHCAAISPNGARVIAAVKDQGAVIWDVGSRAPVKVLHQLSPAIVTFGFAPDGRRLLTGLADGSTQLWDTADWRLLKSTPRQVAVQGKALPPDFSFSQDSRYAAVRMLDFDKLPMIVDSRDAHVVSRLAGHSDQVNSVAFSPDGTRALTSSEDGTAVEWDVRTARQVAVLHGHSRGVTNAAYSKDGRRIVTTAGDKSVRVWDAATGSELLAFGGFGISVENANFTNDDRDIAAASASEIWMWRLPAMFRDPAPDEALAISPDSTKLLVVQQNSASRGVNDLRYAVLRDMDTGAVSVPLAGFFTTLYPATMTSPFSADGRRVALRGYIDDIEIWETSSGAHLATLHGAGQEAGRWGVFNSDGFRYAAPSNETVGAVDVWDVRSGKVIAALRGHTGDVLDGVYSPDESLFATASDDHTVRIWDTHTWSPVTVLRHEGAVLSARFSPDGSRLVTTSPEDGSARIWDTRNWRATVTLNAPGSPILAAAFSPDGRQIATWSLDHTVRAWDASNGSVVRIFHPIRSITLGQYAYPGPTWQTMFPDGRAMDWPAEGLRITRPVSASLSYTANGSMVIARSGSAVVEWEAATGRLRADASGKELMQVSPDGARVVTSMEKTIFILPMPSHCLALREATQNWFSRDFKLHADEFTSYTIDVLPSEPVSASYDAIAHWAPWLLRAPPLDCE